MIWNPCGVYIKAFLSKYGSVDKVEAIKGLGYGLDEIASEAVLNSRFTPGRHLGKH